MRELMELASRQERYYAQNSTYTQFIAERMEQGGLDYERTETEGGYYDFSVVACLDEDESDSLPLDMCYILQAVPKGDQAGDDNCAIIRVDSLGQRESENADGEATDCW